MAINTQAMEKSFAFGGEVDNNAARMQIINCFKEIVIGANQEIQARLFPHIGSYIFWSSSI